MRVFNEVQSAHSATVLRPLSTLTQDLLALRKQIDNQLQRIRGFAPDLLTNEVTDKLEFALLDIEFLIDKVADNDGSNSSFLEEICDEFDRKTFKLSKEHLHPLWLSVMNKRMYEAARNRTSAYEKEDLLSLSKALEKNGIHCSIMRAGEESSIEEFEAESEDEVEFEVEDGWESEDENDVGPYVFVQLDIRESQMAWHILREAAQRGELTPALNGYLDVEHVTELERKGLPFVHPSSFAHDEI